MTNINMPAANGGIVEATEDRLLTRAIGSMCDAHILQLIEHFSIWHDQQAIIQQDPPLARSFNLESIAKEVADLINENFWDCEALQVGAAANFKLEQLDVNEEIELLLDENSERCGDGLAPLRLDQKIARAYRIGLLARLARKGIEAHAAG